MRNSLRAVFFGLLLAGSASVAAWASPDVFRLGIYADAELLDPIATSDNTSIWSQLLIYDTLIRPAKDGVKLEPGLAESWTENPDGTEFVFKLRDAKFSDGTPVTADDVIASLKRAQSDESNWKRFFKPITKMEAVDARTVKIGLDKPFTPLLNNLALFSASILPAKLLQEKGASFFEKPVGSGPFMLKNWARGSKIELAANPNYWQKGKPSLKEVDIMVIGEDNSRVLQLQAGQIDAMINVPVNQIQSIASSGDITAKVAPVYRIDMVQLNTREKPFDNEKVRQALNYAVDKEGIIKGILFDTGTPAISSMPIMRYHNDALKPYPYDPEKAKALLKEAGFPDGFSAENAGSVRRYGVPAGRCRHPGQSAGRRRQDRIAAHRVRDPVGHHQERQVRDLAQLRDQRHGRSRPADRLHCRQPRTGECLPHPMEERSAERALRQGAGDGGWRRAGEDVQGDGADHP